MKDYECPKCKKTVPFDNAFFSASRQETVQCPCCYHIWVTDRFINIDLALKKENGITCADDYLDYLDDQYYGITCADDYLDYLDDQY